jgi:carboxyl-terminal processing protease
LRGLIFDLRFNPGGLVTVAAEISELFIDRGAIVTVKPRNGPEYTHTKKSGGGYRDFPMVCLVNGLSASSSEIVAACLQDHKRAAVAGERTYGKGSVQSILNFPATGGKIKLTTSTFWRPSGKNLNKSSTGGSDDEDWGVRPDPGFDKSLSRSDRLKLQDHLTATEIIRRPGDPVHESPAFRDEQLEMVLRYLRK